MNTVININSIARLAEKNPIVKKVFRWTINFTLQLLVSQRLLDPSKLRAASLDWERGTLDLGNAFTSQLVANTVSEYVINRTKKKWEFETMAKIRKNSEKDGRD